MTIVIRQSETLLHHLRTFEVDGATIDSALFEGGRLNFPGRQQNEQQLGFADPYTIEMEARTIDGFFQSISTSISFLAREATKLFRGEDPTLDLIWEVHDAYVRQGGEGPSLDRLVAALVMVQHVLDNDTDDEDVKYACAVMINGLTAVGFPPTERSLEEIWDGAAPACVGLNLVTIPGPRAAETESDGEASTP